MKTSYHNGLPVYGPRPGEEAMAGRAKRDGFDPATLRPALELAHGGRYWVEVWARPSPYPFLRLTGRVIEHNGIMIPDLVDDPGWLVYRLRRDGKVQCSGQTESADRIVMVVEQKS